MNKSKKFYVTIQSPLGGECEFPMYADSLDEATKQADFEYEQAGFPVSRIRPEVVHHEQQSAF